MASHRDLWKRVQRALTGQTLGRTVAHLVLAELDRLDSGQPSLWSLVELDTLKERVVRDSRARGVYVRLIIAGCEARGIEPPELDVLDPPDDVQMTISIRWYVMRHFEDGMPPPRDPERAFAECCAWLPSQGGMPTPTREGFLRLYPNERAYFARHAREPAEPTA